MGKTINCLGQIPHDLGLWLGNLECTLRGGEDLLTAFSALYIPYSLSFSNQGVSSGKGL